MRCASATGARTIYATSGSTGAYGLPPGRCLIIGDTEHDVACARAAGAHVVAVATGTRTRSELESLEPDLVLDDLKDVDFLIRWARALG